MAPVYYVYYPHGLPQDERHSSGYSNSISCYSSNNNPSSNTIKKSSIPRGDPRWDPPSPDFPTFGFGIEIEAVVQPRRVRPEWRHKPEKYYEKIAASLRKRHLVAVADDLKGSYRSHPEHYNKWFITSDASLRGTGDEGIVQHPPTLMPKVHQPN